MPKSMWKFAVGLALVFPLTACNSDAWYEGSFSGSAQATIPGGTVTALTLSVVNTRKTKTVLVGSTLQTLTLRASW